MAYFVQNILSENMRTVMIPIVLSDTDGKTFDYYWNIISSPNDRLLLVHIIKPEDATKEKWAENKVQISTVINPFEQQCIQRSMNYQVILHMGKPGEGVIDLVKEHNPDLLVIGSRGLSSFRRKLDTSVSEYVYYKANIPVLIVGHDWQDYTAIGDEKVDGQEDACCGCDE